MNRTYTKQTQSEEEWNREAIQRFFRELLSVTSCILNKMWQPLIVGDMPGTAPPPRISNQLGGGCERMKHRLAMGTVRQYMSQNVY